MHNIMTLEFFKRDAGKDLFVAFLATLLIFSTVLFTTQAYAAAVTLSVSVQTSISFAVNYDNFPSLTPGTAVFATTTLQVTTNNVNGWNVTLSGDNKSTVNSNLQRSGETSVQITDQTEWVPNAATSSPGNAVRISSFVNSADVLAFRVMSASSTNGSAFYSTSWWGTTDLWADGANTLWAGIASSTVARQIGNAGASSYSSAMHVNTVSYYLDVSSAQKTGTYTAPLTYTATAN